MGRGFIARKGRAFEPASPPPEPRADNPADVQRRRRRNKAARKARKATRR